MNGSVPGIVFPPVICGGLIEAGYSGLRTGRREEFPPVICGGLIEAYKGKPVTANRLVLFPPVICGGLIEAGGSPRTA